ncbi:lrr receptor-like serine threonine-protein kinase fls2 [Hordeum vulgare]|nr:lrr receptor-like serine threonine-protein kinase fls2 [Hordeum vulgare]
MQGGRKNRFIFTFHEGCGKRKAIKDEPWMFDKDLVVVEDFDPSKRLEDYAFDNLPIWVRVYGLPLRMMNEGSAEEIGNIIGQFVDADSETDGSDVGRFMRIKIRMQIDKSLVRGFTLETNDAAGRKKRKDGKITEECVEEEDGNWCRFEYEFLRDFCYRCGMIGHGEKDCEVRVCKRGYETVW